MKNTFSVIYFHIYKTKFTWLRFLTLTAPYHYFSPLVSCFALPGIWTSFCGHWKKITFIYWKRKKRKITDANFFANLKQKYSFYHKKFFIKKNFLWYSDSSTSRKTWNFLNVSRMFFFFFSFLLKKNNNINYLILIR